MERWHGKIAVVTGASSGIGYATARALVQEGMIVIGLARRKIVMQAPGAKGTFHSRQCDISKEADVDAAFQWIQSNFGLVQVLVNNAGIATHGSLTETSRSDWEEVFNTNVLGLLSCTKHVVRALKQSNAEGHIVNISSIQGHRVHTIGDMWFHVYPATKFSVTAISETLTKELLGTKIRVTNISPGAVKTEIIERFASYPNQEAKKGIDMAAFPMLESDDVAASIVHVIGAPQRVQITELTIKPLGERLQS